MSSPASEIIALDRSVPIPYLEQWLGYWLIEPERGMAIHSAIQHMNISLHVQQTQAAASAGVGVRSGYHYEISEGVGIVEIGGKLLKHETSDGSSTSTVMMRRTIRAMQSDSRVSAAVLIFDSPGGTVAGAFDLADDIAALNRVKPTFAYGRDMVASAAYLMAAQARSISASRTTLVGSIGTVGVVYDSSARAAMMGVKVHVIVGRIGGKPAPHKGAGEPGSEVTEAQIERWQREIDDVNEHFLKAVQSGRRMSREKVESVADGGVLIAERARAAGLIDRVESFDDLLARVKKSSNAAIRNANTASASDRQATQPKKSAVQQFDELVQAELATGVGSKQARKNVMRKSPEIHKAMLREMNPCSTIY